MDAQKLLSYGPEEATAKIHYSEFLYKVYKNAYKKLPEYPVKGAYSPTHWSRPFISTGSGVCSYVYIPTNDVLVPGQQYRISLTIKFVKAYEEMPYYQSHFGVALASDLYKSDFGLWAKHFVPLNIKTAGELVSKDFDCPCCFPEILRVLNIWKYKGA